VELLSPYLIAGAAAWLVSQGTKYLIASIKGKNLKAVRQLYLSGGMPSAHSATVIAVTTVIGLIDGIDSAVFGLAVLVSSVVMYDAVMVRRSSGEQGQTLLALLKERASKTELLPPRVARGHTPLEVLCGAAVGAIVGGVVVYLAHLG
jgi:acid phosphatase family membrane protein YuiD